MSRRVGKEKIKTALQEGQELAYDAIAESVDVESLSKQFQAVVRVFQACIDNFEKKAFIERGHQKAQTGFLKIMLLGAFKSVQAAHDIEREIQARMPFQDMMPSKASYLQIELLKAVTVYRTNGEHDCYAFDIQQMINKFRWDQKDPPHSLLNTPVVAA